MFQDRSRDPAREISVFPNRDVTGVPNPTVQCYNVKGRSQFPPAASAEYMIWIATSIEFAATRFL